MGCTEQSFCSYSSTSYSTPLISTAPSPFPPYSNAPPKLKIMMTNAVIVQITTVSMKGSSKATNPSDAEYLVLTAECAIEADPAPASFGKRLF